jgi:peptide/nickel transport system substrate-binding protein
VLRFSTTVEDTRRTSGQELIKERMRGTGFDIEIDNFEAAVLFTDVVPTGDFTLTEYARGSIDPSVTGFLACENIPSEENGFSGGNWSWWCNEEATDLMHQADGELDLDARIGLMNQVYVMGAADFVMLPLYVLPVISAWRSDRIAGPVGDYTSSLLGMYANANYWYLVQS